MKGINYNSTKNEEDNMFFKIVYKSLVVFSLFIFGATYSEYKNQYDAQLQVARTIYNLSQQHERELNRKEVAINVLENKIEDLSSIRMSVSAYTRSVDECDSDPNITATMKKAIPNHTVAVSRDMIHLLGKKVWIDQVGVRYVTDLMKKGRTKSIDILVDNKSIARQVGRQNRTVVVL